MKQIVTTLLLSCCAGFSLTAQSTLQIGNTTVEVDTVYTGLTVPWEIKYGSDGYIWTTERSGIVSRINPQTHTKTVVLNITSTVYPGLENGLLGFAFHPNFPTVPEVFLAYTYDSSNPQERIVKYTYNGSSLVNEVVLLDHITAGETHCGARLAFLADGTLLASTGDAQDQSSPQNQNALNGKFLRLNTDGTAPSGNISQGSFVYTYGHRNAQGLLVMPDGKVYISEHGNLTDDEFQLLEAGRNYGWPNVEGFCDQGNEQSFCTDHNVKEPITAWSPTIAPSDLVYYDNDLFPEWDNRILMTVLKDKKVVALQLNAAGDAVTSEVHYLTNTFGRLRDICIGPDKEIYLATNGLSWGNMDSNHSIIVLRPQGGTNGLGENVTPEIRVAPNPFTDQLTVTIPAYQGNGRMTLTDACGRLVFSGDMTIGENQLHTSQLHAGTYFLQVEVNGQLISTHKIIK